MNHLIEAVMLGEVFPQRSNHMLLRLLSLSKTRVGPFPEIVLLLQGTSYGPTQRTLERHLSEVKKGGTRLSTEKASGRRPKLSEKQWEVVAGWILTRQTRGFADDFLVDFK
jgi:hypothetical protein